MKTQTKIEARHFAYLDDLRESGETNMFGARPYLQEEFYLSKEDASAILQAWMKTFDGTSTPEERVAKAEGGK